MNRPILVGLLGFLLAVMGLSFKVGPEIQVPVGGARGPLMLSGLGPSEAATGLTNREVLDQRQDFYFREMRGRESQVNVPLRPRGPFAVALRMDSTVGTAVSILDRGGVSLGGAFVSSGPWQRFGIAAEVRSDRVEFALHFQDAPLVRRSDPGNFRRYLDEVVLTSEAGFDLPWESRIAGGLLLLFLAAAVHVLSPIVAFALAVFLGPALLGALLFKDPVALSLALPRLLGFVILASGLIALLCRILGLSRSLIAIMILLGSGMVLVYGSLSFLPNHAPPDLDIHLWRTSDLASVPPTYYGWLLYGSHYPTPSQAHGAATEALGAGPLIPYSPLPYFIFYAGHAAGLDLHWSMNAIEITSLALLLPLIFAFGRAASSETGGLLAAVLMALDLATIHRLGRAHSPAVVGGALGIAGLLALGLALPRMGEPSRWRLPAVFLGLGALGYSSTPVFYALFGLALLSLVALSPETRLLMRPIALALGAGGAAALVLFYGHYVSGLAGGGGSLSVSDSFPGRTFFIFHNESRQSLRLWRLGLFIPFLAAIPAVFLVIARGSKVARAFLLAWVTAWAGIMLMKEPWVFPRLLRWAKEDLYVAPALVLIIAIAVSQVESRPLRIGLTALCLVTAIFLRAQDYGFHADTLRFMR